MTSPVKKTVKITAELYERLAKHGKMNLNKSVDEVTEDVLKVGIQTLDLVMAAKNTLGRCLEQV